MQTEIAKALKFLKAEKLILYPTDTIWGIGCDATNPDAVISVYQLKKRVESKALICLVSDFKMLENYINPIPETVIAYLEQVKKPTTIIYNNPKGLAENLLASDNSIGIRIVSHGFPYELLKQFNKPIVSTSANISGEMSPKSFKEISQDILKGVDYVVNLPDEKSEIKPSTILKIEIDGSISVIRK